MSKQQTKNGGWMVFGYVLVVAAIIINYMGDVDNYQTLKDSDTKLTEHMMRIDESIDNLCLKKETLKVESTTTIEDYEKANYLCDDDIKIYTVDTFGHLKTKFTFPLGNEFEETPKSCIIKIVKRVC